MPASSDEKKGFFSRIHSITKSIKQPTKYVKKIFGFSEKKLSLNDLESIKTSLLEHDCGSETSNKILDQIKKDTKNKEQTLAQQASSAIEKMVHHVEGDINVDSSNKKPFVVLVVGSNGSGKTTTIAKLANIWINKGKSVLLVAGDTFRAAAVEQLEVWCRRLNCKIISGPTGSDSASLAYKGIEEAEKMGSDIVMIDTSGRLHNKENLMQELKKIKKVIRKIDDSAPHETLLILDIAMGQTAISYTETFYDMIGITGVILTKADGTARGGTVVTLSQKFDIPIYYVCFGEAIDDIEKFESKRFADELVH